MFIQENGLEAGRLVELDQYLYQYLVDAGYHAVVFFNRIDSFYNPYDRTGEMLKLFYKEAEIVNDNEKPDLMQAMSAIRVAMKNEEHSIAVVINMAGQLMSSPGTSRRPGDRISDDTFSGSKRSGRSTDIFCSGLGFKFADHGYE